MTAIVGKMLLNPTSPQRMQTNGKKEREREVKEGGPAAEINDGSVIGQRERDIQKQPAAPHRIGLDPRRAGQLHQRKEQQPNGLTIPVVPNEASLPVIRKVGISFV